ncbi:hypothetical protein B0H11DRAFT_2401345 [Mycena galericulata]|nr:hypothetical protein B0H11DRAFT_2401345 [Mycena galericulata]
MQFKSTPVVPWAAIAHNLADSSPSNSPNAAPQLHVSSAALRRKEPLCCRRRCFTFDKDNGCEEEELGGFDYLPSNSGFRSFDDDTICRCSSDFFVRDVPVGGTLESCGLRACGFARGCILSRTARISLLTAALDVFPASSVDPAFIEDEYDETGPEALTADGAEESEEGVEQRANSETDVAEPEMESAPGADADAPAGYVCHAPRCAELSTLEEHCERSAVWRTREVTLRREPRQDPTSWMTAPFDGERETQNLNDDWPSFFPLPFVLFARRFALCHYQKKSRICQCARMPHARRACRRGSLCAVSRRAHASLSLESGLQTRLKTTIFIVAHTSRKAEGEMKAKRKAKREGEKRHEWRLGIGLLPTSHFPPSSRLPLALKEKPRSCLWPAPHALATAALALASPAESNGGGYLVRGRGAHHGPLPPDSDSDTRQTWASRSFFTRILGPAGTTARGMLRSYIGPSSSIASRGASRSFRRRGVPSAWNARCSQGRGIRECTTRARARVSHAACHMQDARACRPACACAISCRVVSCLLSAPSAPSCVPTAGPRTRAPFLPSLGLKAAMSI